LGQGRARHRDERHVAMLEVQASAVDMVGPERAAHAAFLPSRPEHEMLDDQLAASAEEVGERLLSVGSVEHVSLLDLHPRQLAPLGAQAIAQPGEFLLPAQMLLAGNEPLVSGHDAMVRHGSLSGWGCGSAFSAPPLGRSVRMTRAVSPPVEDAPAAISATVV